MDKRLHYPPRVSLPDTNHGIADTLPGHEEKRTKPAHEVLPNEQTIHLFNIFTQ